MLTNLRSLVATLMDECALEWSDTCTCKRCETIRAIHAELERPAAEPNGELQRLRAENEVLRTGFFQLADFADQQRQSVMGRLAENRSGGE
jgi:hypothetical protein